MSEIHERLVAAFDYLRVKGVIHTQAEFAEAINKSPQQVSDAFKDRPKRCTLGLMKAIATAYGHYINKEWLRSWTFQKKRLPQVLATEATPLPIFISTLT